MNFVYLLLVFILFALFISVLIENNSSTEEKPINKKITRVEQRKQQRHKQKSQIAENEERCANCLFLNYIDDYYAANIYCKIHGFLKAPRVCSYFSDKRDYVLVQEDDGKTYIKNTKTGLSISIDAK